MTQLIVSHFFVTVVATLLPGIIACAVFDKLAIHIPWNAFKFSIYTLLFSAFTYLVLGFGLSLFGKSLLIWDADNQLLVVPGYEALLTACLLAIVIALSAAWAENKKALSKIARQIGIRTKPDERDLFHLYLNSKEVYWVIVRDIENGITYYGIVANYAENEQTQELILHDATIYQRADGKEHLAPSVYIAQKVGKLVIVEANPTDAPGFMIK